VSEHQPEKQTGADAGKDAEGRDDAPVPRLPRGKGIRLSTQSVIRIGMFATLLVAVVVMQRPCADNVSRFVTSFGPDAGASARPTPAAPAATPPAAELPAGDFVRLTPDMTEEEIRRKIGQATGNGAPEPGAGARDAGAATEANPTSGPSGKPD